MRRILVALAVGALALGGCGRREDVRHYRAPKEPTWSILAAIAAGKDQTWFFKVTAPSDRISAAKKEILDFYQSLRSEKGEILWSLPAGWLEEKGTGGRLASLKFGDREPKLEVTIMQLAGDGGGLPANLNRWREQLGLDKVPDAQAASQLQKISGAGVEVLVADLTGPSRPGSRPPKAAPAASSGESTLDNVRSMFSFERPPGWRENPKPKGGRIFEFSADGGALVTFSILGGDGGGVGQNVDRWRGQAGLEPLGEAAARSAEPFRFVGQDGWRIEAVGKDKAILAVFVLGQEYSMFLKMDGPAAAVTPQRDAFNLVAKSFRMTRHE